MPTSLLVSRQNSLNGMKNETHANTTKKPPSRLKYDLHSPLITDHFITSPTAARAPSAKVSDFNVVSAQYIIRLGENVKRLFEDLKVKYPDIDK
jgi:hypothetical protein